MTIRLKTVCPEFLGALPDGEYEVPTGCTALEALAACMTAAEISPLPETRLEKLVYMRNSRHVKPDAPLSGGGPADGAPPAHGGIKARSTLSFDVFSLPLRAKRRLWYHTP